MLWGAFCWYGFGSLVPLSGKSHFKSKQSYSEGPPLSCDYTPLSLVMILIGIVSSNPQTIRAHKMV